MIHINTAIITTYGILTLAQLSLWLPLCKRSSILISCGLLLSAILSGLMFDILQPSALIWIALLGSSCCFFNRSRSTQIKTLLFVIICALSTGLISHRLPGFSNPKIILNFKFSVDALPYDKYLNFDSLLIGFFILGCTHHRVKDISKLKAIILKTLPIAMLSWAVIMMLSVSIGYVHWHPKWTPVFFLWAWGNLIFTCMVEEAFFRGFIQKQLMQSFSHRNAGDLWAIVIAAGLFGIRHYAGGVNYILLSTIAGLGYGWAYQHGKRIEASIFTHFSLNTLHVLLFTYPALATPSSM